MIGSSIRSHKQKFQNLLETFKICQKTKGVSNLKCTIVNRADVLADSSLARNYDVIKIFANLFVPNLSFFRLRIKHFTVPFFNIFHNVASMINKIVVISIAIFGKITSTPIDFCAFMSGRGLHMATFLIGLKNDIKMNFGGHWNGIF